MNTRCPQCGTVYQVDPDALDSTRGKARCYQCHTIFDTQANAQTDASHSAVGSGAPDESDLQFSFEIPVRDKPEIPFDFDEDIPALEPSQQAALDVQDTLEPKPRKRSPWWQSTLALLLGVILVGQLLWWWRAPLLQLPITQPLCEHIDCRVAEQRAPQAFLILERSLAPDPQVPNALRLWLRVRNDADFAQALPHVQLTLSDSTGSILARRSLGPTEYLYPSPAEIPRSAPGEVTTIELLFEDPGTRASGFELAFY